MFRIATRFAWIPTYLDLKRIEGAIPVRADRWVWLRKFYYIEELRRNGWHSDEPVYDWEKTMDKEYLKREEADNYLRKSKGLILHKGVYRKP